MTALEKAIEDLYDRFRTVPKPHSINASPYKLNKAQLRRLRDQELRSLSEDDLWSYAFSLFLTVGDTPDFRYFLPRIFELMADTMATAFDPEIVLSKLMYAGWESWPLEEQQAIKAYLDACFAKVLEPCLEDTEEPYATGELIDAWLCGLSVCLPDISAFIRSLDIPGHGCKKACLLQHRGDKRGAGSLGGYWNLGDEAGPFAVYLAVNRDRFIAWMAHQPLTA